MISGLLAVGYFLFSVVFSLLTFILWVRITLRYFQISVLHPINQSIHRFTDPLVRPFARIIKPNKGRLGRYDWPCFTVLILIELIKFVIISVLFLGSKLPWNLILTYTIADLIIQPCNLLFYIVIIRVIMSWVNPYWQGAIADLIRIISEPSLSLARRITPIIASFDFSPFVVLIVLKIITLFISASLPLNLI